MTTSSSPSRPSARPGPSTFLARLLEIPLHPWLVFAFPILSLLAWNIAELYAVQAGRSLLISLLVCTILWAGLYGVLRDGERAALLTSLAGVLIFTYGHLYDVIEDRTLASFVIGRHRYLLAGWVGLLAIAAQLVSRWRGPARPLTKLVNGMAIVLVAMPLVSLTSFYAAALRPSSARATRLPSVSLSLDPGEPAPDIYYIILDGYARDDYMQADFDFDNSEFIEYLEDQGFYVASRARSNHNWTALSLSSSLNLTFAQFLGAEMRHGYYPTPFTPFIRDSLVARSLKAIGYQTVGMQSGYLPTEWVEADAYLGPAPEALLAPGEGFRPNAFEGMLLDSTVLQPLLQSKLFSFAYERTPMRGASYPHDVLRAIILAAFDNLASMPNRPGPKVVFAHIVAPHSPFLFAANGQPLASSEPFTLMEDPQSSGDTRPLYREQAIFITGKAQETIAAILEQSDTPPVIILQSDHGSGANRNRDQRTSILNALLIQEDCRSSLYPEVTPVNTFRIVFNCYFDARLPIVQDEVYWSPWPGDSHYEFTLLPTQQGTPATPTAP